MLYNLYFDGCHLSVIFLTLGKNTDYQKNKKCALFRVKIIGTYCITEHVRCGPLSCWRINKKKILNNINF